MPPLSPSQQNSRAALITSLVIFVVLFVTATVLAIYFNTQWKAADKLATSTVDRFKPAMKDEDFNDPKVLSVMSDAAKKGAGSPSAIRVALDQRDFNAKVVTGNPAASVDAVAADTTRTVADVKKDLADAKISKDVADTIKEDNLLRDLKVLSGQVVVMNQAAESAAAAAAAANDKWNQEIKAREGYLAEKQKAVDEANKARDASAAALAARDATVGDTTKSITDNSNKAIQDAQQQTAVVQAELTKISSMVKKDEDQIGHLKALLRNYRLDPSKALMQPAGFVTRIPGNNIVFISLGEGESISPGLTFEVYDKHKGLPSLAENPNAATTIELPDGKASIEVVRVMQGTSECRVIKSASNMPIVEGDLILNLVWNAHIKFNFVVYGNFDLAGNGQFTPGDAEVIRRLITQWGGKLMEQVNVDTDFVVMGKDPSLPVKSDDNSAVSDERYAREMKAYDAYHSIKSDAINLNIPVLNQDRFLYFVGYYDQAKR